jgi:hypothetical protein
VRRLGVSDEQAAEEWRRVWYALGDLANVGNHMGERTLLAVIDAQERVGILSSEHGRG